MLFTKDERSRKIIAYNHRVRLWESSGISELQSANFSATVNHSPLEVHPLHEGSGVNYPFRDPCNKKGDPVCERGTVFYYGATISNPESDFRLQIKTNTSEDPLFGESVSFNRSLHLRKRDIGCSGGNEKACITECEKHSGVWNCSSNLCIVQIYLTSICVRLAYHNETSRWTLDVPPQWRDLPSDISFGCQPSSSQSWSPYAYSPVPPSSISLTLRHHQDPFITASAITAGCSSSTNVTTSCFGRSRHDDLMMMSLFLTAGLAGVITDITLLLRLRRQAERAFVASDNLQEKKSDNGKDEKTEENAVALELYSPLMLLQREIEEEQSFNLNSPRQKNDLSLLTPSFKGDRDGI
ncbi:hypothetical protein WA588_000578 [Blastocystis sp. NMH]